MVPVSQLGLQVPQRTSQWEEQILHTLLCEYKLRLQLFWLCLDVCVTGLLRRCVSVLWFWTGLMMWGWESAVNHTPTLSPHTPHVRILNPALINVFKCSGLLSVSLKMSESSSNLKIFSVRLELQGQEINNTLWPSNQRHSSSCLAQLLWLSFLTLWVNKTVEFEKTKSVLY